MVHITEKTSGKLEICDALTILNKAIMLAIRNMYVRIFCILFSEIFSYSNLARQYKIVSNFILTKFRFLVLL